MGLGKKKTGNGTLTTFTTKSSINDIHKIPLPAKELEDKSVHIVLSARAGQKGRDNTLPTTQEWQHNKVKDTRETQGRVQREGAGLSTPINAEGITTKHGVYLATKGAGVGVTPLRAECK